MIAKNPKFNRIERLSPDNWRKKITTDKPLTEEQKEQYKKVNGFSGRLKTGRKKHFKHFNPTYWNVYDRMVSYGHSSEEALSEAENFRSD